MFQSLFSDLEDAFLEDRLDRVQEFMATFSASTREDFQAELYSQVNRVLALGHTMQPLLPVSGEGPALVGDVTGNTRGLNQDAEDIADDMLRIEDTTASLYNLSATSQNSLRQKIRELILASNHSRYVEPFLNDKNVQSDHTASLDFGAGIATLPLVKETQLTPNISVGSNSVGAADPTTAVSQLIDGKTTTAFVWNGSQIELIVTFDSVQIMNRIEIQLDDYQGLELTTLTTSPDGSLREDVLSDIKQPTILLNGVTGKYSGEFIIDFPPRHTKQVRIVIEDRVDIGRIALRDISFWQRQYGTSGQVTSNPILAPSSRVRFTSSEISTSPLTQITHQLSYNGVHFVAITPGTLINLLQVPFWYRAVLTRNPSKFSDQDSPLITTALDPVNTQDYVLESTTTIPVGGNMMERTLVFSSVSGAIILRETPLEGTLMVQSGAVILGPSDYAFDNNTISFPQPTGGVTVSFQTSALGSASLQARMNYYTPTLSEARFERA